MHVLHKNFELSGLKTSGLADGEFVGWASTFGNIDSQGDRVVKGAFAASVKSIAGGDVTPVLWEHVSTDPRMQIGQIKSAEETDEGLKVHVALDLDTETGRAAYKAVKSRRVKSLSIGYGIVRATKAADGAQELAELDLVEVSLVARPANTEATITASKAGTPALVKARKAAAELDDDTDEPDPADPDLSLGEQFVALLDRAKKEAQALIDAAEADGRDLTDDEAADVEKSLRAARGWKREISEWARMSPASRYGLQLAKRRNEPGFDAEEFERRWGTSEAPAEALIKFDASDAGIRKTKSHKEIHDMNETTTKFLDIGSGRRKFAAALATKMSGQGDPSARFRGGDDLGLGQRGTKALVAPGALTTDLPVAPTVIPTGRPATSILDVIPSTRRVAATYAYLRQSSRALNAAAVAEGAEKPVSTMGIETVENTMSVVAHLTEGIPKFVLEDQKSLVQFVGDEMLYGLDRAIEAQALNGSGTGANQRGILATSGIQTQEFDASALISIRKAQTKAEALGYAPSVAILRPEDWEAIELTATSADAIAFRGLPIDLAERKVWGLQVALSTALPSKVGLVLDPAAVSIDTMGRVDTEWDQSGELFRTNMVQGRVETRIGISVFQPSAIYKVATQAA